MKDDLEKYIHHHRADFDEEMPSLDVWKRIDQQLPTKPNSNRKIKPWLKPLSIAAAVLLLVGILIGTGEKMKSSSSFDISQHEIYSELEEVKYYYEKEIKTKQARLIRFKEGKKVQADLSQIDQQLEEIYDEIKEVPPGAEKTLLKAMIQNYRIKMDILERVLLQLEEKTNQTNKYKHETQL